MESAVRTLLGLIFYNSTEPLFVASCCEYIGSSSAALSRHSFQSSVLRRSVESGYVESAIVDRVIYYMYVAVSRGLRLLPRHRESVALTSPVHSLLHAWNVSHDLQSNLKPRAHLVGARNIRTTSPSSHVLASSISTPSISTTSTEQDSWAAARVWTHLSRHAHHWRWRGGGRESRSTM